MEHQKERESGARNELPKSVEVAQWLGAGGAKPHSVLEGSGDYAGRQKAIKPNACPGQHKRAHGIETGQRQ